MKWNSLEMGIFSLQWGIGIFLDKEKRNVIENEE